MSLTNEYKELDQMRLADAEKSKAHYQSVDLPGKRTFGHNADDIRARIQKMSEEKAKPNHE